MRFIHFSDTHLGFSDLSKIDPETGLNQRESDFYRAWWHAIDKILELRPDFVLHAGDLFQSPRPNNRAIRIALEGIQRLGNAGIPFVVVAGNHSTPRIRQTGSIFESIALFPHVSAAYQSQYERFRIGDCAIHCIPHCPLSEQLNRAYEQMEPDTDAAYQILLTHGAWRESEGDFVGSIGEFNEQFIENPELRVDIRFDYIALGHYHKHIEISPRAVYSGSTERTSFNEVGYTSGLVFVDLSAGTRDYLEIPSRPMVSVGPLDCRGCNTADVYALLAQQSPVPKGGLVRLELTDLARETMLALDMAKIDSRFEIALYVEKVLVPADDHQLQRASASIGSLPGEFERYLDAQTDFTLDRDRFLQLGLQLLDQVESDETVE